MPAKVGPPSDLIFSVSPLGAKQVRSASERRDMSQFLAASNKLVQEYGGTPEAVGNITNERISDLHLAPPFGVASTQDSALPGPGPFGLLSAGGGSLGLSSGSVWGGLSPSPAPLSRSRSSSASLSMPNILPPLSGLGSLPGNADGFGGQGLGTCSDGGKSAGEGWRPATQKLQLEQELEQRQREHQHQHQLATSFAVAPVYGTLVSAQTQQQPLYHHALQPKAPPQPYWTLGALPSQSQHPSHPAGTVGTKPLRPSSMSPALFALAGSPRDPDVDTLDSNASFLTTSAGMIARPGFVLPDKRELMLALDHVLAAAREDVLGAAHKDVVRARARRGGGRAAGLRGWRGRGPNRAGC